MSTGAQLKLKGMSLAAAKHREALQVAQLVAQFLGRKLPTVNIEDVYQVGIDPASLGQAAGSVFTTDLWECVGYGLAKRPTSRQHLLRHWRLRAAK